MTARTRKGGDACWGVFFTTIFGGIRHLSTHGTKRSAENLRRDYIRWGKEPSVVFKITPPPQKRKSK